jgi:hypothetical protein
MVSTKNQGIFNKTILEKVEKAATELKSKIKQLL